MRNLFIEAIEQVPEAAPASKPPEVGHFGLRETESEAVSLAGSASNSVTRAAAALARTAASRRTCDSAAPRTLRLVLPTVPAPLEVLR